MVVVFAVSSAWVGVIGALGGVAITGLIGLATAILNHGWTVRSSYDERATDVRLKRADLRRAAYARYVSAYDNVRDAVEAIGLLPEEERRDFDLHSWYQEHPELLRQMQSAEAEARILAGDAVLAKLDLFVETGVAYLGGLPVDFSLSDEPVSEAKKALLLAMRTEQATDLGQFSLPAEPSPRSLRRSVTHSSNQDV